LFLHINRKVLDFERQTLTRLTKIEANLNELRFKHLEPEDIEKESEYSVNYGYIDDLEAIEDEYSKQLHQTAHKDKRPSLAFRSTALIA
jgi:hypothetical protein